MCSGRKLLLGSLRSARLWIFEKNTKLHKNVRRLPRRSQTRSCETARSRVVSDLSAELGEKRATLMKTVFVVVVTITLQTFPEHFTILNAA